MYERAKKYERKKDIPLPSKKKKGGGGGGKKKRKNGTK